MLGLGNKPNGVSTMYSICCFIWGLFFLYTAGLSISVLFTKDISANVAIAFGIAIGLIIVAALVHGELMTVAGAGLQYLFFAPTFLMIFPIYSFTNLHDISWGTKGVDSAVSSGDDDTNLRKKDDVDERVRAKLRRIARVHRAEKAEKQKVQMAFQHFRSVVLLVWMFSQGLYTSLLTLWNENYDASDTIALGFLQVMFAIVAFSNVFRFVCSMSYLGCHLITKQKKVPAYPMVKRKSNDEDVMV